MVAHGCARNFDADVGRNNATRCQQQQQQPAVVEMQMRAGALRLRACRHTANTHNEHAKVEVNADG